MYANCRTLWLPKAGRSAEEYEDAYWPRADGRYPLKDGLRSAVSDGATESSFARRWARQLVIAYCSQMALQFDDEDFRARVRQHGANWLRHVYAKPLAWNFLTKAQRGAYATLTGVHIQPGENGEGNWDAVAVGDSCLFQMRSGEIMRAWPEIESDAFGFHPQLLCSIAASNDNVWAGLDHCATSGAWEAGDLFLLMTDALAKWFVGATEKGERPCETLLTAAASSESFIVWVEERRTGQEMPNDDVTLMLIALEDA